MQNISIDFDGVLNEYSGYNAGDLEEPRKGAKEFLKTLSEQYDVIIHTARDKFDVEDWLEDNDMAVYVSKVSEEKLPSIAYIDDRAIQFNGDYEEILKILRNGFKPYWKKTLYEVNEELSHDSFESLSSKLHDYILEENESSSLRALGKIRLMQNELNAIKAKILIEEYDKNNLLFKDDTMI